MVVSIPTFGCTPYLRHAVESVLAQTHQDLAIYVVSDGDGSEPWSVLEDLNDERVHLIELSQQRGPYFVHDLLLRAVDAEFLLTQDADDWSEPNRLAVLMAELTARRQLIGVSNGDFYEELYQSYATTYAAPLKPEWYLDRVRHHGLYRRSGLLEVGGYYAGFRFAFDSYLVNMLYVCHAMGYVDVPLYHRRRRADSLSRSARTGIASAARDTVVRQLTSSWRTLLGLAQSGVCGPSLREEAARLTSEMLGQDATAERDRAVHQLRCQLPARTLVLDLDDTPAATDGC